MAALHYTRYSVLFNSIICGDAFTKIRILILLKNFIYIAIININKTIKNIMTDDLQQVGGWRRRHIKKCRTGSRRCYNDNCVEKSMHKYKTTMGRRKCHTGSHKCRDNRCHKRKIHYSRRRASSF